MVAAGSREEDEEQATSRAPDVRALLHELSESLTAVGAYLEAAEIKSASDVATVEVLRKGRDQLARANRALRDLRAALPH